jgi:hypothetical protein
MLGLSAATQILHTAAPVQHGTGAPAPSMSDLYTIEPLKHPLQIGYLASVVRDGHVFS